MIIVLLFFFQSICLYCQRLVLYIHDRIHPKNARILKEALENSKLRKNTLQINKEKSEKRSKPNYSNSTENCRFCINSPQGYCRHHFHLQELQVQKQQKALSWNVLNTNSRNNDNLYEYRQLRKINRLLKSNLKNQLCNQQQQQQHQFSQQKQKEFNSISNQRNDSISNAENITDNNYYRRSFGETTFSSLNNESDTMSNITTDTDLSNFITNSQESTEYSFKFSIPSSSTISTTYL